MLFFKNIFTHFYPDVVANDGVTLTLQPNEILGLTGESGCGKTTLANIALALPTGQPGFWRGEVGFAPNDDGTPIELYSRYLPLAWTGADSQPIPQKRWLGFGYTAWKLLSHYSVKGVERELGRKVRGGLICQLVSTSTALNDYQSVREQIQRAIQLHRNNCPPDDVPSPAELIRRVALEADLLERKPTRLSGGERTRVAIALGLACNPEVIIADETTTGLDVITQRKIVEEVFGKFKQDWETDPDSHSRAILLITHDIGVINNLCDRVAVMQAGKVLEVMKREDSPTHLHPSHFQQEYPQRLVESYYHYTMVSQHPEGRLFQVDDTYEQPILELDNLWIRFPKVQKDALSEVKIMNKLSVNRGEHVAIVGQTGCGKTTLGKTICHLNDIVDVLPQSVMAEESLESYAHSTSSIDTILLNEGYSIQYRSNRTNTMAPVPSPQEKWQRRCFHNQVQMLYQHSDRALFDRMTVFEILAEAYETHFHLHPDERIPESDMKRKLEEFMVQVKLDEGKLAVYPNELSEGQRRRISFLRTLIAQGYGITERQTHNIIVADEPTSGIDVISANTLLGILRTLIQRSGVTLILITHDLRLVNLLCPRMWVMKDGQIFRQYRTVDILDDDLRLRNADCVDEYTRSLIESIPRPDEKYS
jgi:ABC-type glutathione transport system ATPase component